MNGTAILQSLRGLTAALPFVLACASPALAQYSPAPPPGISGRNPACLRYEGQLASLDRGTFDPTKAAEIKRYEDAAGKQQAELDRLNQQAQRMGCKGAGFFALFSGQPAQCGPLNNQIQQIRANIDGYTGEIQRLQGNSADREGQRRSILMALGQNDCGPQYRRYANQAPGGFFENLFGIQTAPGGSDVPLSGTYRTLCVRTCDGYYFPISYSTVPSKFVDDEQLCQRLCPASEAVLYSHRNPGEDVTRAVSTSTGRLYTELPTAFSYRKAYNEACSCRAPGQSWADALKQMDDQTVERGDIVVRTEEQAKALSQPRVDAQGRPIRLDAVPNGRTTGPGSRASSLPGDNAPRSANAGPIQAAPLPATTASVPDSAPAEAVEEDTSKRKVRAVGPTYLPR
jgi:Protein of unknown function (DUF2865)